MAAAAQAYSSGPPPPYSSWPGQDSRRTSDNKPEPPSHIQPAPPAQRQSLPSIHEALNGGPRSNSYKSPESTSFPPAQLSFSQPPSSSRYPSSEQTTYSHAPPAHRQPSPPHPIHPQPGSYARPVAPAPSEPSRRTSLTPIQPVPGPSNPYTTRYEPDLGLSERASNGYSHHPPQQTSYQYGPQPHQIPPTTPHEPAFSQPRYQTREGQNISTPWKANTEQNDPVVFQKSLKRNFEGYDFENRLSQIGKSSNVLKDFSSHYIRIANEQQRSANTVPDRMPDLAQCSEMLHHAQLTVDSLNRLKEMVYEQEQTMMADRIREQGARSGGYDDEMSMYGDDLKSHGYGEGKKRRGRAAPPGRCHSCNRAETPEWRRGPDGARTLCNACGLHYAKLTRKNTMKQSQGSNGSSSLRPKSMDGSDGRPPPPLS